MEFHLSLSNDYDARSITVLEGLEAVRKRPGMYIGSTGERGLHHLVYEVVDNSVDEALAGYATDIEVTLLADGGVRVVDDGRGIPVDEHPIEHRPAVEVVHDHAARRRQVRRRVLRGLRRPARRRPVGGERAVRPARRGDPQGRLRLVAVLRGRRPGRRSSHRGEATDETGTTTTFWPDGAIFETTEWSFETLSRRMQETAFLNRGLRISLTDERPAKVAVAEDDEEADPPQAPLRQGAHGRLPVPGRHRRLRPLPERLQGAGAPLGHRVRRRDRRACRSRSRCSGTPPTPSRCTRSRT